MPVSSNPIRGRQDRYAWTADEIATLRRLWPDASLRLEDIGRRCGSRSVGTVSVKARALGLPARVRHKLRAEVIASGLLSPDERRAIIAALPVTYENGVPVYHCPPAYCAPVG